MKTRLDVLMVERGLAESREKAKAIIMSGNVFVDGQREDKAKNKYSLEEHEQFRDAIVQQILMQLDGIEAQLNGDGTYTEQGDLLYIFTIDEGDIVTTQYYIVKDYGFCLIQLTNFSGSETTEQAARDMVDSFVWDTEG